MSSKNTESEQDGIEKSCPAPPSSLAMVERIDVENVPGTFQLLNVLSKDEAKRMGMYVCRLGTIIFISAVKLILFYLHVDLLIFPTFFSVATFEELGFTDDAAVSLPKRIRHNSNLVWIADNTTLDILWGRCKDLFTECQEGQFLGQKPVGLNGRFRVYRYEERDYFRYHTDGSWPGTRVVESDGHGLEEKNYQLVKNAFGNHTWSLYSILFFLTDDFVGGETQFLIHPAAPSQPAETVEGAVQIDVRTPVGGALCFPHGEHPLHCLHSSTIVKEGIRQ
jgi:hypothetical protein